MSLNVYFDAMNNFLVTAYAFSWIALVFSSVLWFFFKKVLLGSKVPRVLIQYTLVGYILSFLMIHLRDNGVNTLGILLRDLGLWAGFALLAWAFAGRRNILLLLLAGILIGSGAGYFDIMRVSAGYLPNKKTSDQQVVSAPGPVVKAAADAEILFDIKKPESLKALEKLLSPYNVRIERAFPLIGDTTSTDLDEYYLADIPESYQDQQEAILSIIKQSDQADDEEFNEVLELEPFELQSTLTPPYPTPSGELSTVINDPYSDSLLQFPILNFGTFYTGLKRLKPVKKARIAILDTGVDAGHEDLKGHYFSLDPKYDKDVAQHGTHCAGIAAAVVNNGIGIASCAGEDGWVEVGSVKVLNDFGGGTEQSIINGIIVAADNGADVISMSLGGPRSAGSSRAYDQAIQYANRKGTIVVVAAGNENRAAKTRLPAGSAYAITVAAVDNNGNKAVFSNWFSNYQQEMGVAAPGVGIFSTIPGNRYARFSGTSMATPCVAGLIAVIKAIRPDITTPEVYQLLYETGVETGETAKTGRLIQPATLLSVLENQ